MTSGVSDNALMTLKDMLRKEMNSWTDNLIADETCKDFADYKYRTGVIHGLALAERDLLELNKRIEEA